MEDKWPFELAVTSPRVSASLAPVGTGEGAGVVSQRTILVTTQWSTPRFSYRPSCIFLDHPDQCKDIITPDNITPTWSLAIANL